MKSSGNNNICIRLIIILLFTGFATGTIFFAEYQLINLKLKQFKISKNQELIQANSQILLDLIKLNSQVNQDTMKLVPILLNRSNKGKYYESTKSIKIKQTKP